MAGRLIGCRKASEASRISPPRPREARPNKKKRSPHFTTLPASMETHLSLIAGTPGKRQTIGRTTVITGWRLKGVEGAHHSQLRQCQD